MSPRFLPTDAFLDESIRGRRYLLGCVLIEARQLSRVRPRVEALGVGGSRLHFNNESRRRKAKVLEAIAQMPVEVFVVVCHRNHGVTEFQARATALGRVVNELQGRRIGRLVIESRQDDRDDERAIHRSRRPAPRLVFEHRVGSWEPMLWVADAATWAVGAGGDWRELIRPVLTAVVETRP